MLTSTASGPKSGITKPQPLDLRSPSPTPDLVDKLVEGDVGSDRQRIRKTWGTVA